VERCVCRRSLAPLSQGSKATLSELNEGPLLGKTDEKPDGPEERGELKRSPLSKDEKKDAGSNGLFVLLPREGVVWVRRCFCAGNGFRSHLNAVFLPLPEDYVDRTQQLTPSKTSKAHPTTKTRE
jgi:hypothetical protein